MRICVLAHALQWGGGVSVGKNLIASLAMVAPNHSYFITIPAGFQYETICEQFPECQTSVFTGGHSLVMRFVYESGRLFREIRKFAPDVILGLGNRCFPLVAKPQAVLIHNAFLWTRLLEITKLLPIRKVIKVAMQQHILKRDLRKIDLLLGQTHSAENHIRQLYKFKGSFMLCPNSVTCAFEEAGMNSVLADVLKVQRRKILFYPSAYYPHKNFEIIISLFNQYKKQLEDYVAIFTLDVSQSRQAYSLLDKIIALGLKKQILNVGYLRQTALPQYYKNSYALLMPTLLESFSGAYLEAMKFGVPILTSDKDFSRETCGNAALYFDPTSTESIYLAIKQLEANREYQIQAGAEQIKKISMPWDQVAVNVVNALENIVRKTP